MEWKGEEKYVRGTGNVGLLLFVKQRIDDTGFASTRL